MSHRRRNWHLRAAPTLLLVLLVLPTAACRTDVEGYWEGTIGDESAFLSLEQSGARVRGEACLGDACDARARGDIVEEQLSLSFGCPSCEATPEVVLDLAVIGDEMEGIAILESCACEGSACGCGRAARFERVSSYDP